MTLDSPLAEFEIRSGAQRGSHLTLYPNRLVHQGGDAMETVPLAQLAAGRVAFEGDPRKLHLGVALFAANACYVFAYDTEYAMVDRDDDLKIGIRTSAITLGKWDVPAVIASYCMMLAILAGIGIALRLPWFYYLGLLAAASMLIHHWRLIRDRTRNGCFSAFRHSHWIGAAVFAGILAPVVLR